MLDVAANFKRRRRVVAPARRQDAGADLREALARARACRSRSACASSAATWSCCTARDMQLGRGETIGRHRARAVALRRCDHDAHRQRGEAARAGGIRHGAGDQRADRHVASVPADGRRADVRGASRPDRRAGRRLVRRRQQRRAKLDRGGGALRLHAAAGDAGRAASAAGPDRLGARAGRQDRADRRSGEGGGRRALRGDRHLGVACRTIRTPAGTTCWRRTA